MLSAEIRRTFLEFFAEKGHLIIPSSSLIPEGDPTLLLTNAGMVQVKPYFMGEIAPPHQRLASVQKCFRTSDIESVGNERSLTFFEMLGNFSVGDYFKGEAIAFAWELVTQRFHMPVDRLWVTIHPEDNEAYQLWQELTPLPAERIVRLEENWWGPAGETGPCGPDSELYLDRGAGLGCGRPDCKPGCSCERFLEFWNLVFMQYYQDERGQRTLLPKKHIDTGLGIERVAMLLQGRASVYETDLFAPLIQKAADLTRVRYGSDPRQDFSLRVIADHSRAITFLVADGVLPSNEGRGYILRRVLRRAIRHGRLLGLQQPFLVETAETVIALMQHAYPEMSQRREFILTVIALEEERFNQTLGMGLTVLDEVIRETKAQGWSVIPGERAFRIYDTYGFPKELTVEVAVEHGLGVDLEGFEQAMEHQRETARAAHKFSLARKEEWEAYQALGDVQTKFVGYEQLELLTQIVALLIDGALVDTASAGEELEIVLRETPFYPESGGQVGDTGLIQGDGGRAEIEDTQRPKPGLIVHRGRVVEGQLQIGDVVLAQVAQQRRHDIAAHHTATHLLQWALRNVLGSHVHQSGSLVLPDHLRFDFSHPRPLSEQELDSIEDLINQKIREDTVIGAAETSYAQAIASGAIALFGEKYSDIVRMVKVGDYSLELCGGTHVQQTGEIGYCHLISEVGIGTGLRRIEAVAGRAAQQYASERLHLLERLERRLQTDDVESKVETLLAELQSQQRQIVQLQRSLALKQVEALLGLAEDVDGIKVVAAKVDAASMEILREMGDMLREQLGTSVVVLGTVIGRKPSFVAMVSPDLPLHAGQLLKQVAAIVGGSGGGRADMAQAGGKDVSKMQEALRLVSKLVRNQRH
ncbi:MAG: alanine--tRNA ligase [Chloroflexi bacterium]|nr:alanine--tRNA ligase [Chloroflexota bacterium]